MTITRPTVAGPEQLPTGNPTLTLNNSFSPVSVTMKSTSHNYTLSGSGGITGTASLTLDPANTQTHLQVSFHSVRGLSVFCGACPQKIPNFPMILRDTLQG